MHSGLAGKKRKKLYVPPTSKKLPIERARQFVIERTSCSDQEATELLESMREELRQKEQSSADGDRRKRSA